MNENLRESNKLYRKVVNRCRRGDIRAEAKVYWISLGHYLGQRLEVVNDGESIIKDDDIRIV